jgi:hypothetical protein
MKTFSGPTPPKLCNRTSARNYLLTNTLVLPGLGSWLAGERFVGILQMMLAFMGLGFISFWFVSFLIACLQTQTFPVDGGPHLLQGMLGVVLSLASWFWALGTSLRILRATRTTSA